MIRTLFRVNKLDKNRLDKSLNYIVHLLYHTNTENVAFDVLLDRVWSRLMPVFRQHVVLDALWCRVCERLVCGVPDRYMESVVTSMIQQIPWCVSQ